MSAPPVPATLRRQHRGWRWSVAWAYYPGAVTYRLEGQAGEIRFLKLATLPRAVRLEAECARTRWASAYLPVPEVVDCGMDGAVEWMLTRGVDAPDATDPELRANPGNLVAALGRGLRRFHQAPVDRCPFDFRLDAALELVRQRLAAGLIDPEADLHPEHRHLTPDGAYAQLVASRPESEDLVVCHGDYAFPNALVEGGEVVAYLDLGELGVADRWWDLAVATWSTVWNLGPGWEATFLAAYGIDADEKRTAYYRLLYDLVS